jgi:hypothetical protein
MFDEGVVPGLITLLAMECESAFIEIVLARVRLW